MTSVPAPCRGLSRAEINQGAALAILRVAGGGPEPVWRRRAAGAAPFLSHLITGAVPAARSQVSSPGPGPGAPAPSGGRNLALDTAALVAWLSPLVFVAHGLLAIAAMALMLLAALGPAAL